MKYRNPEEEITPDQTLRFCSKHSIFCNINDNNSTMRYGIPADVAHIDEKMVDNLLAKEMLSLDMKERTAIEEEIHGIQPYLFTPEMEAKVLSGFDDGIKRIPAEQKTMYLRSLEIPDSYIHSKSFRLRILRSITSFTLESFCRKVVDYCDYVVDLFGEIGLKRPIRLSDFSREDLQLFRLGRMQFLPFGDRLGRRIGVIFPDEVYETFPAKSASRIYFYTSWVASNDDSCQRQGMVAISWIEKEFKITPNRKRTTPLSTVRLAAVHICMPDTPLFRLRGAVVAMMIGRYRMAVRRHIGM